MLTNPFQTVQVDYVAYRIDTASTFTDLDFLGLRANNCFQYEQYLLLPQNFFNFFVFRWYPINVSKIDDVYIKQKACLYLHGLVIGY